MDTWTRDHVIAVYVGDITLQKLNYIKFKTADQRFKIHFARNFASDSPICMKFCIGTPAPIDRMLTV